MARRVVITGLGCVTPLGRDVETTWNGLVAGHSAVDAITLFDASAFPVRIAAEVSGWDESELGDDRPMWSDQPRQAQFAVASARQAVRQAQLAEPSDPRRFGVYLGCGETFPDFQRFTRAIAESFDDDRFSRERLLTATREWIMRCPELNGELNATAGRLAATLGAHGPNANFVTACASSSQAVGEAIETIRRGDAEVMLAGGAHSMIHAFGLTGFHRLAALSRRNDDPSAASRPFDRDRDGFVVGEGAAALVLEASEHAEARGAEILGEALGYGASADAHRITDSHPEVRGAARAITKALEDARVSPEEVDYINAHATSTGAGDRNETLSIKKAFGSAAPKIAISSVKSMLGHLTTAAGALEAVVCLMAVRHDVAPPTINYQTPDPNCDLDYVPNEARSLRCDVVLSNSFGFGGQNVALVFGKAK